MAAFSDDMIRAIVAKARYTEAGAAHHIASTLIKRRDKVLRAWLTGVNPLVDPRLTSAGTLTFEKRRSPSGHRDGAVVLLGGMADVRQRIGSSVRERRHDGGTNTGGRRTSGSPDGRAVRHGIGADESPPIPGLEDARNVYVPPVR